MLRNHISGVLVSVLTSSPVDRGFELRSGQMKDYDIGNVCLSARQTRLRGKSKDSLAQYQNDVPVWRDMSIRGLFLQCASTIKIQLRQQSLTHSYCYHYNVLNISPITPHTHLYSGNTLKMIIWHPSYCYHYNVINMSAITPHIYIIQL